MKPGESKQTTDEGKDTHFLAQFHALITGHAGWQRLAILSRILLAAAFLPTGLTKIMGNRFSLISTGEPIGYFFEAMYQSGFYYQWIGAAQVTAAILLLIPRTAALGAVMYLPIILNIFIITVSLHFTGTPYITGMMLLATVFLLFWEYDRFRQISWFTAPAHRGGRLLSWEPVLWGCGAAVVFALAYLTRFSVIAPIGVAVFVAIGFLGGLLMRWHLNGMRAG